MSQCTYFYFREKSYQSYFKNWVFLFSNVLGLIFQNHLCILAFMQAFNLFSFQFSYRLTSAFLQPTGSLAFRTTRDYTVSRGHWMDILSPALPAVAWPDYLDRSSWHPHDVGISQHLSLEREHSCTQASISIMGSIFLWHIIYSLHRGTGPGNLMSALLSKTTDAMCKKAFCTLKEHQIHVGDCW